MENNYEEVQEPVSPHGQYFNSSVICSYVFGFLELAIPIDDDSQAIPLLKDVFLPINPRFSSIMVRDKHGKKRWQKVEVNLEEHVKIPKFPETTNSSSCELYDNYLNDYVTTILTSRTPQDKPLWEIHLIKYPTTNAAGTIIFKLHHALGDVGAGPESMPFALSNISLSLDHLKEIKSKLGVTINDVICGIIFYGIRLYMEEMNNKTKTSNSTTVVMLNTRNVGGYQSLKEMQKPESKSLWGNQISFLQVSIPKLSQSDPLEFVWKARKLIKRKRRSFGIHLIGLLLNLEMKLKGHEAVAKIIYNTMGNSSVVVSNLVGPVEKMALANHPINGLYFTMTGGPENVDITIMSYVKILRITLRTLKGFIDEQKFKFSMEKAIEVIFKAAMEISQIPTKN
ncbi:hypothetical protein P8452_31793 [Trifolium repens]|nr:hypothetical protein P8452_31793 [Trifolium repens]